MTNHVRTLLLNLNESSGGLSSRLLGVCYITKGFAPFDSPTIRRYRTLFQFMQSTSPEPRVIAFAAVAPILHGPALAAWTRRYDTRVTYDPAALGGDRRVLANLLEEVSRFENESTIAELQRDKTVQEFGLSDLLTSKDSFARLGAVILAYVDVHNRECEKAWQQ